MSKKKKDETKAELPVVTSIKGFNKDLTCREFKFEAGKTYETKGKIEACRNGFHACENPLDVFSYYPAGTSVFHEVEQSGDIARHDEDSKIASAKITIGVQISVGDIVRRGIAWIAKHASTTLAVSGHAASQGYSGHAASQGHCGHAASQGDRGHAASQGHCGHAASQGDRGHAASQGDRGHAASQGHRGHAASQGHGGHAASQGYSGHAASQGHCGHAASQGDRGHAASQGHCGHAASQGHSGHAASQGYRGHAASQGDSGHAASQGDRGHAETHGKHSIAVACGYAGRAKAPVSGAIMLACISDADYATILRVRASKVGENGVKPDTWYRLSATGEFVEDARRVK